MSKVKEEKVLTVAERMEAMTKLQNIPPADWKVRSAGIKLCLFGDQVTFGDDSDFVSLKEAQEAVLYLCRQFNITAKINESK